MKRVRVCALCTRVTTHLRYRFKTLICFKIRYEDAEEAERTHNDARMERARRRGTVSESTADASASTARQSHCGELETLAARPSSPSSPPSPLSTLLDS